MHCSIDVMFRHNWMNRLALPQHMHGVGLSGSQTRCMEFEFRRATNFFEKMERANMKWKRYAEIGELGFVTDGFAMAVVGQRAGIDRAMDPLGPSVLLHELCMRIIKWQFEPEIPLNVAHMQSSSSPPFRVDSFNSNALLFGSFRLHLNYLIFSNWGNWNDFSGNDTIRLVQTTTKGESNEFWKNHSWLERPSRHFRFVRMRRSSSVADSVRSFSMWMKMKRC